MKKKLYRSRKDKIIAGICGGIGRYFDIDPNLVRIIAALICLTPPGILTYLIAWIVIPSEPEKY
jgi:phage shock protein C